MVRVLFVCMGNICRSPTSQGVFEKLVDDAGLSDVIHVDSAGTHAYHVGKSPDSRAQLAANKRGYNLAGQRARIVSEFDFEQFDYVLAMDHENMSYLETLCPPGEASKLRLFMEFADIRGGPNEVPDPYYGSRGGFERVLDLVEEAAKGLLEEIQDHCEL